MTEKEAMDTISDEVYYSAMMLKNGEVDAMVSGSLTPTAKTVRASLIIVKPGEGIKTVSGSFAMIVDSSYGSDGASFMRTAGSFLNQTLTSLLI